MDIPILNMNLIILIRIYIDYLIYNPSGSYDWPEIEDHDKVFSINRFGVELTGIYAK